MWEHTLETTTDVAAADLWAVAADARGWPAWRPGVEAAEVEGDPRTVRVRGGGRWSRVAVEAADPPARLVLVSGRFLARTRTVFAFTPTPCGTAVRVVIEVRRPAGLFRAATDDGDDPGLVALVRALVARARVKAAEPHTAAGHTCPEAHPCSPAV